MQQLRRCLYGEKQTKSHRHCYWDKRGSG
jgi:hypothetical protein